MVAQMLVHLTAPGVEVFVFGQKAIGEDGAGRRIGRPPRICPCGPDGPLVGKGCDRVGDALCGRCETVLQPAGAPPRIHIRCGRSMFFSALSP